MRRAILLGALADALFGDPKRFHPVAGFGHTAAALERRLWRPSRTNGVVHVAALVGGAALAGRAAGRRTILRAFCVWIALGMRSLEREALELAAALEDGRIDAARRRAPALVGRDPAQLEAHELARAVVESVAENTGDAIVAPLLWAAVGGAPGVLGHRAVNTLDAMIGHRSARYSEFGWAAARLDDAANWLPARVGALLAAGFAPLVEGSPAEALRILRRDGHAHPSPNAGRLEAAFAGALGLRLGGRNVYQGRVEERPSLGDGTPPRPRDVRRAVRLSRAVGLASTLLCAAAAR